MILDDSDDRVYVAPSTRPGAGQGLFARVDLRAGDRLTVLGVLVPRGSTSDHCTAFADAYKYQVGDYLLIPCGLAAMVNHAAEPNLAKVVEGHAVFLELLQDVMAGEELCFTYSRYACERYGIP